MEIKIEMPTNPEFIRACGIAPEIIKENLEIAARQSCRFITAYAKANHNFTTRSSALENSIKEGIMKNADNGSDNIVASVGLDTTIAPYGPYQHRGTGKWGPYETPFIIRPVNKKQLRWAGSYGFVWHDEIVINGINPDPFLFNAADAQKPKIDQTFADYVDRAIDRVFGKE